VRAKPTLEGHAIRLPATAEPAGPTSTLNLRSTRAAAATSKVSSYAAEET
jgi:hypothetical protein